MPFPLSAKAAILSRPERRSTDWPGIWALSLGVIALSLAALVYFADRDPLAAALVLIAFAAILGVVLRESSHTRELG